MGRRQSAVQVVLTQNPSPTPGDVNRPDRTWRFMRTNLTIKSYQAPVPVSEAKTGRQFMAESRECGAIRGRWSRFLANNFQQLRMELVRQTEIGWV